MGIVKIKFCFSLLDAKVILLVLRSMRLIMQDH